MNHENLREALGFAGAVLLGIALFWWLSDYASAPLAQKLGLGHTLVCLVATNTECRAVGAASNSSYTFLLFWVGALLSGASAVLQYARAGSKGGKDA